MVRKFVGRVFPHPLMAVNGRLTLQFKSPHERPSATYSLGLRHFALLTPRAAGRTRSHRDCSCWRGAETATATGPPTNRYIQAVLSPWRAAALRPGMRRGRGRERGAVTQFEEATVGAHRRHSQLGRRTDNVTGDSSRNIGQRQPRARLARDGGQGDISRPFRKLKPLNWTEYWHTTGDYTYHCPAELGPDMKRLNFSGSIQSDFTQVWIDSTNNPKVFE